MQNTKPILSISLLASNRKKTIRKCLESLRPIMDQVTCELIIVDTGCDDEVRSILTEYTQHIISFIWCHDFSKARNAGLKEAVGEWFLFIDDDEWFEDATAIIDFFKSGEYKQYGLACYIQRNYADYQEKHYQDAWVSRIIRLSKETRFVGSIHEYLWPVKGANKLLHAPVKHFGYIFDSEEEKYQHSQRNISLLLAVIKKERDNSRWWVQLAQEYRGIREYQKLHEMCEEALQQFARQNNPHINKERGCFYLGRILADLSRYMYKEAVKAYEKAIADKRNTQFCQAALYAKGAAVYFKLEQYQNTESCCRKYLEIYQKLHDMEEVLLEQGSFFIREAFNTEERNNIYSYLIICGLKYKDNNDLKLYFDKMEWQSDMLYVYGGFVPAIVEYYAEAEYEVFFQESAEVMINRKGVSEKVIQAIQKIEKKENVQESFMRLARIFSGVNSNHYYIIYLRILYAGYMAQPLTLSEDFAALFKCVVDIFQLPDELWNIAESYGIDLEPMFLSVPFDQWKKGVDSFMENSDLGSVESRRNIILAQCKHSNTRYDYFFMKAAEAQLVYGKYREECELLHELFHEYTEKTFAFYGRYYKENAFQGEMELLPLSCRAAVSIKRAIESEQEDDPVQTLTLYKECIGIFRSLDKALNAYCHLYKQKQDNKCKEQAEINTEMHTLLEELKKKMIILAENGMEAEALHTFHQIKIYMQDDEIHELAAKYFPDSIVYRHGS